MSTEKMMQKIVKQKKLRAARKFQRNLGKESNLELGESYSEDDLEKFYHLPKIVKTVLENKDFSLLEGMSDKDISLALKLLSKQKNIKAETVSYCGTNHVLLRYYAGEEDQDYLDNLYKTAQKCRLKGNYSDAIKLFNERLSHLENPSSYDYAKLGFCHFYRYNCREDQIKTMECFMLANVLREDNKGCFTSDQVVEKLKLVYKFDGVPVFDKDTNLNTKAKNFVYKKS